MRKKSIKLNKGAALLLSLFITSIVSIIGYRLFDLTIFTSEIEKRYISNQQSLLLALSLESYTLDFISSEERRRSLSLMTNRYDPYSPIEIPIERGNVLARIEDKSDCFNLNLLVTNKKEINKKILNKEELKLFKNLLISLEIPDERVEIISASLIDWIDYDDFPDNYNGAEDFYYSNLKVPYLPFNGYLRSITEIRQVKGILEDDYKKMSPYICALPINIKSININSISPLKPKLLIALSENKLSDQEATYILENRPLNGYVDLNDFFNDEAIKRVVTSKFAREKLTVDPFYFNLKTQIKYDEFTFIMNSRLLKDNDGMRIITRKVGSLL